MGADGNGGQIHFIGVVDCENKSVPVFRLVPSHLRTANLQAVDDRLAVVRTGCDECVPINAH